MPNRPNLLFIFTDEQRHDTLACYGNTKLRMPNLNRFADTATVVDRAYCTQPVCTPSRGSIVSGLYPFAHGARDNNIPIHADCRTLPELLADRGAWHTGYYGKWHLGDEIFRQHGFDDWCSFEDDYIRFYGPGRDRRARSDYHHFLADLGYTTQHASIFTREFACQVPEPHSKPAFLADQACRFIRNQADRPFALYVNFLEPHMPFFSCRDRQYAPDEVDLPANLDARPADNEHLKKRLIAARCAADGYEDVPLKTEADWRFMTAKYWGLNSLIDTHVGRILRALTEAGLDDNTIVVFTSDHGEMMGSHGCMFKNLTYEESIRVPLLVRVPGQRSGRRLTGPFSQIDLVPTLLELMGQPVPDHLHGRSRADDFCATGDRAMADDAVVIWHSHERGGHGAATLARWGVDVTEEQALAATNDEQRTLLAADGWKLTLSPVRREHELFDLASDPQERTNLFGRPDQTDRVREMARRLIAWQARTGDRDADLAALGVA